MKTKDESERASLEEYAPGSDRPLGGYAVLMGVYGAAVTAGAVALRRRNRPLPDVRPVDIAAGGGGHPQARPADVEGLA